MRICYVHKDISNAERGGVSSLFKTLATAMSQLGHDVFVITQKDFKQKGITTITLPKESDKVKYSQEVTKAVMAISLDTCECSSWGFELLDLAMKKPERPKIVVRLEPSAVTLFNARQFADHEKSLINLADAVIAVSNFAKDDNIKQYGIKRNIIVLHNGIDVSFFSEFQPKYLMSSGEILKNNKWSKIENVNISTIIDKNRINVFWIGKTTAMKGFDILQNIINSADPRKFNFIINLGFSEEYIKIERLTLLNAKIIRGLSRDNQLSIWKLCNVFLSTSRLEGFGLVVLESAALHIPSLVNNECKAYYEFFQESWGKQIKMSNELDTLQKIVEVNAENFSFSGVKNYDSNILSQMTFNVYKSL